MKGTYVGVLRSQRRRVAGPGFVVRHAAMQRPAARPLRDALGLLTSTDDQISLEAFERALESLFRSDGDALAIIEHAITRDPAFAGGHCLRAVALIIGGTEASAPAVAASIAAVEGGASANERERRHAIAARLWVDGKVARAARAYDALAYDYPRDRLALLAAQALDFRLRRSARMQQLLQALRDDARDAAGR